MRVRQAIAYAIDRDAIVTATSYGTAAKNQLAIPKGNFWYTDYGRYRYDIERPNACSPEANASPANLDMLVTNEYPETVTAAQIIADNLAPLGITVNIRTVDFATWLDEQNSGHFDMLMMGWLGNIDPDDFYYAQHHTDGSSNAQKFSNPEVDRLLDAGRVETNQMRARRSTARPRRSSPTNAATSTCTTRRSFRRGTRTCPATKRAATRPFDSGPRASAKAGRNDIVALASAIPVSCPARSCASSRVGCCTRSS